MESKYLLLLTDTRAAYMWIQGKESLGDEAVARLQKRIAKGSIVSISVNNPRYDKLFPN